jgi:hypothetical protein
MNKNNEAFEGGYPHKGDVWTSFSAAARDRSSPVLGLGAAQMMLTHRNYMTIYVLDIVMRFLSWDDFKLPLLCGSESATASIGPA